MNQEAVTVFGGLIVRRQRLGFIKVRRGTTWDTATAGTQVPADQVTDLVRDPAVRRYEEQPAVSITAVLGDRDITGLEAGIGA
ncbi:hypothetical protein ACFV3E_35430 [Streptomyces sp. NPDC059718]